MKNIKYIIHFIRRYTLCKLGLHLVATVIEQRPRYRGKHISGVFRYGTSNFTHFVQGYYEQCICCNKNLVILKE